MRFPQGQVVPRLSAGGVRHNSPEKRTCVTFVVMLLSCCLSVKLFSLRLRMQRQRMHRPLFVSSHPPAPISPRARSLRLLRWWRFRSEGILPFLYSTAVNGTRKRAVNRPADKEREPDYNYEKDGKLMVLILGMRRGWVAGIISDFGKRALLRSNTTAGVGLFVAYVTRVAKNRALFPMYCAGASRTGAAKSHQCFSLGSVEIFINQLTQKHRARSPGCSGRVSQP